MYSRRVGQDGTLNAGRQDPRHADLPADHRGAAVFAYLGVPPEQQVPEIDRDLLAARLHDALPRQATATSTATSTGY